MRRVLLALLLVSLASGQTPKKRNAKPQDGSSASVAMTGCIDQRGDEYILTGDQELTKKAVLKGRAFTDDNFARYVGHKVKAYGSMKTEGERQILHVDRIEDIQEGCSPP